MRNDITFKVGYGLSVRRRRGVIAGVLAMIVSLSAGCSQPYISTVKVAPPTSEEIGALSEGIKELVMELEYSDKVAEDFAEMVMGWQDGRGHPALAVWKKQLSHVRKEYAQGQISENELAQFEESASRVLSKRIQKVIGYEERRHELVDAIRHKKNSCLGYSQLLYIVGNSIGLSFKAISVPSLLGAKKGDTIGEWMGHAATIVSLASGEMIIVDLVPGGLISGPFTIEKEYAKVDDYYELKAKHSPLGMYKTIRVLDTKGLIAALYRNRGVRHERLGELSEAISDYTTAIEFDAKSPAYLSRGIAYEALDQYSKAISDYNKATEMYPKYASVAYSNRGAIFNTLGQRRVAVSDFDKAIELDPECGEFYWNRGTAYAYLGQFDVAAKDFIKALELNPALYEHFEKTFSRWAESNPDICKGVVKAMHNSIGSRQFNKVMPGYSEDVELNPDDYEGYTKRGAAYSLARQYDEAISEFSKAIQLNPQGARAYWYRGIVYARVGKVDEANKDVQKMVALDPQFAIDKVSELDPDAGKKLLEHYGSGLPSKAMGNRSKAIEPSPNDIPGYIKRGNAYYRSRRYSKAISEYSKAIELDSDYAAAYYNRGNSYASLKKVEQAKKDLLKAAELNPALKPNVEKSSDIYKLNLKLD